MSRQAPREEAERADDLRRRAERQIYLADRAFSRPPVQENVEQRMSEQRELASLEQMSTDLARAFLASLDVVEAVRELLARKWQPIGEDPGEVDRLVANVRAAVAAVVSGTPEAPYVYAECADHPGEIEYPDSGCAKCRDETSGTPAPQEGEQR